MRGEPENNDETPKFSHDRESWGAPALSGEEKFDDGVGDGAGTAKAGGGGGGETPIAKVGGRIVGCKEAGSAGAGGEGKATRGTKVETATIRGGGEVVGTAEVTRLGVVGRLDAVVTALAPANRVCCLVLRATGDKGAEGAASSGESESESTLITHGRAGGRVPGSSSLIAGWDMSALTRLSCS